MVKSSTVYICQNCEAKYSKWQGQCDNCGEWGTLVETLAQSETKSKKMNALNRPLEEQVVKFSQVKTAKGQITRLSTGIGELDRVLGPGIGQKTDNGIVPGSVMLIGGEPGIGKSTLLTQMILTMLNIADNTHPKKIIYVCGEESPQQISIRIKRILENEDNNNQVKFGKDLVKILGSSLIFCQLVNVDQVVGIIEKERPDLVIVDSIQTMTTDELTGAAGSAGQLRESTDRLTTIAKAYHIPMFLVGHVTKEGAIAGPKILEHIVDTVLELSGERTDDLRILRTLKNRFGPTDEVGVFRVSEAGLEEISNPSQIFLEHTDLEVPGTATVCVMEGTRPLLVEVQALVVDSQLAMPRRVGRGIELSRIQVLSAILQKHCGLPLGMSDIFLSVAGGFKVKEPAVDLGLAMAIVGSLKNKSLPNKTIFIGEIGLLGEIRSVSHLDRRIKEAKRLGYDQVISRKTHQSVKDVLSEFKM